MTTHTVLIVDDEPSILTLWTRMLSKEGYAVLVAADADGALRVLATRRAIVVVCDVHLPGESGVWLAEEIRQRYPATAIVLATGDPFVPPPDTVRPPVIACLLKPVDRKDLLAAVKAGIAWVSKEKPEDEESEEKGPGPDRPD